MKHSVVVTQPGSHHLWRTAAACYREGTLAAYVTSVFYRPDRFPFTLLRLLPQRARERLRREASKRGHDELDGAAIMTAEWYEWLHLISQRLLGSPGISRWLVERRNSSVSARAGSAAIQRGAAVLWGGMDGSREAFERAKPRGVACVLDAFIGHPAALTVVLEAETSRRPGARSRDVVHARHLARLLAEIDAADLLVVGSEFAKDTYLAHGIAPERVRVIPYGVDTEQFKPSTGGRKTADSGLRLLFVGNVSVRKGCSYLMEAMRLIPNFRLTLVGTLEDRRLLDGAGTNVSWHPQVAHRDLPRMFREADVYVFPSLFEGSSLSIYEALASGLPVVTTRESGSVVREGGEGFIIPTRDATAIATAVARISTDGALRERMGQAARARALEYTWETYYKRVIAVVRELEDTRQTEKDGRVREG